MQVSKVNDWMQLFAAIGVFASILFLAHELSQNNQIAMAERTTSSYQNWIDLSISEYESGIKELFVKSIENPEDLTTSEIMKLDAWLVAVVSLYQRTSSLHFEIGVGPDPSYNVRDAAAYYFGGRFARSWFWANEAWLKYSTPEVYDIVKHEIESTPVQTEFSYLDKIKSGL